MIKVVRQQFYINKDDEITFSKSKYFIYGRRRQYLFGYSFKGVNIYLDKKKEAFITYKKYDGNFKSRKIKTSRLRQRILINMRFTWSTRE